MKLTLIPIAALILSACAAPYNPEPSPPPQSETPYVKIAGEIATPAEREACEAAGGTVQRAGLLGWENCVIPYADGGKVCSDNSECLGQCRYTGDWPPKGDVTGLCQKDNMPFGCYSEMQGGQPTPMLCVD